MASSLRLPLSSFASATQPGGAFLSPSCVAGSYKCRSFSQMPQRWGYKALNVTPPRVSTPSMKTRMKDISMNTLPNDIGLLPGTFVRPLWKDMPSIFQEPKQRWQMEWTWMRSCFQNILALIYFCKWETKTPLVLWERRKFARRLQNEMYSAFASGDDARLKRICCDNLYKTLSTQIAKRPKNERLIWSLTKYLRTPTTFFTGMRVLSDRATKIPDLPDSSIRQIILRITSRQSTTKTKVSRSGDSTPETKEQDCTEHIVIQNITWMGKASGWQIWGHAKPTTVDAIYNDPHFAPGLSVMERLDAIKNHLSK